MIEEGDLAWWRVQVAAEPDAPIGVAEARVKDVAYDHVYANARVHVRQIDGDSARISLGGIGGERHVVPLKQLMSQRDRTATCYVSESTMDAVEEAAQREVDDESTE